MPDTLHDQLMQRFAEAQKQVPDAGRVSVRPMNWLDRLMTTPGAPAASNLLNQITYDPAVLQKGTPNEQVGTFVHELTHAAQNKRTPFLSRLKEAITEQFQPYHQRASEMEAFQNQERAGQDSWGVPDFLTGRRAAHRDIQLPTSVASK